MVQQHLVVAGVQGMYKLHATAFPSISKILHPPLEWI